MLHKIEQILRGEAFGDKMQVDAESQTMMLRGIRDDRNTGRNA